MKVIGNSKPLGFRGVAMIATSVGAIAVGAFAIGALAIGRLAVRRVVVENAKFKSIEIDDLIVKRIRAAEVTVSDSLEVPGNTYERKTAR